MGGMQPGGANIRTRLAGALRDTGLTALIALGVFLPLVGFQTTTNIRDAANQREQQRPTHCND